MKKQKTSTKKLIPHKKSFNLFLIITILFPITSWIFIIYYLLYVITEIFNISILKFFFTIFCLQENVNKGKLEIFQNIYTAFFVGFIAAYFTVLSIFLGRKKKLGFKTALKHMLKPNLFWVNVYLLLVNFIIVEYYFTILSCCPISGIYTEFSILQLLMCFSVGIANMFYMEEPSKAADLLNKYLNKDLDFAIDYFVDFVSKSFKKNKFEILLDAFERGNIKNKEQKFGQVLERIDLRDGNATEYEGIIKLIIHELYGEFATNHSAYKLENVQLYYNLLYATITQFVYSKSMNRSYLLEARKPLFLFVYNLESDKISEKEENLILDMLNNFKRIIIISFCKCNFDVTREEISHFLEMSLTLQLRNISLLSLHTKYVMDLITWIFNFLQVQRIDAHYLAIIPSMFANFEFSNIEIFDFDTEMYDEGVNPGQMHEIIYTRNYYIAMILIYCELTNKYSTKKVIQKLRYTGTSVKNEGWQYKNVLQGLNNIVKADFVMIMPEYRDEFETAKSSVKELLEEKINEIQTRNIQSLRNKIDYKKVNEAFDAQKTKLIKAFEKFSEKTEEFEQLRPIRTELTVSLREIEKDTSLHVYRADYYSLFFGILFKYYTHNKELQIIEVQNINDLPYESEKDKLLIPYLLYSNLYKIKDIQFTGTGSFTYAGKEYKMEFTHENIDFIVLKSDIEKFYLRPEINDSVSKISEEETTEDINFMKDMDVIFSYNRKMKLIGYKVKQISSKLKEI